MYGLHKIKCDHCRCPIEWMGEEQDNPLCWKCGKRSEVRPAEIIHARIAMMHAGILRHIHKLEDERKQV